METTTARAPANKAVADAGSPMAFQFMGHKLIGYSIPPFGAACGTS